MTDRLTADTINSDALDQLYSERDEARQHAAAIAAQRDRLRQRMNNLADRWDNALAPDKPYARTLREEISCAPFDPGGAMVVQEYTERGRHLWAFRCWGTDTCDGWLGLGHHTETSALLERERHVAEEHGEPAPGATEATQPDTEEQPLAVPRGTAAALHEALGQLLGEQGAQAAARVRVLHRRNEHTGECEYCSVRDYPTYAVPYPCDTVRALDGEEQPT
ncbi:hypothetical protein [Streptomyces sp. AK02-04a]|uniref:hypothetical protein n=1 Tax=Streptomyces sp. AK02-04a TaxID=3028649 RepID=UPI0029A775DE|nr:hypothetical protein [Streptomyces sp. AK02-04a]MDX3759310.1 hypothetical protein [Streptomyces sp. AK02-04a]